jgi:hypothetical protein
MRIIPYDGDDDLEDIESLTILIKAVPFQGSYSPAFTVVSPYEDYLITMPEAICLMEGIDLANSRIDELIAQLLLAKRVGEDDCIDGDEF